MLLSRRTFAGAAIAAAGCSHAPDAQPAFSSDDAVRDLIRDRVRHLSAGEDDFCISVGLVDAGGARFVSYGRLDQSDTRQPSARTPFEIASLTKAFTALVLADMVTRGELALTDPAARYLPARIRLTERNGRAISLLDLATHTSGLPFMPLAELSTQQDLEAYVSGYELTRDVGAQWDYSNIGYWLLSEAMAACSGRDFATLLRERVVEPLGLRATGFAQPDAAPGHDTSMGRAPRMSNVPVYSLMPAAGLLYSSIEDLSTVLSVAMGHHRSPLARAFALMTSTRRPSARGEQQGLGWSIVSDGAGEIVYRDGGSVGGASCVAWSPARRVGVAVLSNQSTSVTDIARRLLDPSFPLANPEPGRRAAINLDAAILDAYVGRYADEDGATYVVSKDSEGLVFTPPSDWGLPPLNLRAETPTDFFALTIPLRARFEPDANGGVSRMLIYPPRRPEPFPTQRLQD